MPAATTSPCAASSLGTRLAAGARATGLIAGTIEIWNSGNTPCRVDGAVSFTALLADGTRDTNAAANVALPPPPLAVVLPARMTPPAEDSDPAGYLAALLSGFIRDDAQQPDGLCRPQDELTPSRFVLSIGDLTLEVPNQNAAGPDRGGPGPLYGCHGNVVLEQVKGPRR